MFAINTLEFVDDGSGAVRALRVVDVEQETVDGRPSFVPVDGSEREIDADLVLLAMGFTGPERAGLIDRANAVRPWSWT